MKRVTGIGGGLFGGLSLQCGDYRLDALLAALKEEGVEIDPKHEDFDYGRFAWIMDPEGNRVGLWEPV